MKAVTVPRIVLALLGLALFVLGGCAPGYYYPPRNHVEVVSVDPPDIIICPAPDYDPPPVIKTPDRDRPISKSPVNNPRVKTPRNDRPRGEGTPRTKGGRYR